MTIHGARRRGRPTKFGRPSQPVTITLPEDVVAAFRAVDPDLSRAIVQVAQTAGPRMAPRPAVELTRFGHHSVIVLAPNKAIERLPGVSMVPLPDGRALISLDADVRVAELEVLVRDALDAAATSATERASLQVLADILRSARRSRSVRLRQRNIIVLEHESRPPHARRHARRTDGR